MTAKTAAAFVLALTAPFASGQGVPASASVWYTAKLVLEDGRPFPSVPLALPPLTGNSCLVHSIGLDGKILYSGPQADYVPADQSYTREAKVTDRCLAAFLIKGYGKVTVTLHDRAVIIVKRSGPEDEGLAVSVATLEAPEEARKAWEKGVKALDNQRWGQAEKELRRAVTIYPQYASAWTALGEALAELSRPAEARAAWERAIQADPNYVKPYVLLAQFAIREGKMEEASSVTGRALEVRYTQSVPVYFYNAVANLALGRLEAAEKSARKAVDLDPQHQLPKAELLLGTVLAGEGNRQGAVEHMKEYLKAVPKAQDAQQVKQRIAELER